MTSKIQETQSKDTNVKPPYTRLETKADVTNSIAKAINETDYAKRMAKTHRLRTARLEQENNLQTSTPKKTKSKLANKT